MNSKRLFLGALLAAAMVVGASAGYAAEKKTKVGFVYVGPIGDHGWSYQHNVGRMAIAGHLAIRLKPLMWNLCRKALMPPG